MISSKKKKKKTSLSENVISDEIAGVCW